MLDLNAKNLAQTELAESISDAATSFTVKDASVLPDAPFRAFIFKQNTQGEIIAFEVVEVGSVEDDTLSDVERGLEGTTAQPWSSGDKFANVMTAEMYTGLAAAVKTHLSDYTAHILKNTLTLYVDSTNGNDANNGLTTQTAKKTIQAAVNAISILVVAPVIIDIAEGTYNEAVIAKYLALDNILFQGKKDASNVPTVILEGTGLGANKSGITASFCRTIVYVNDIKAQNYSTAGFEAAYGVYMNVTNGHMYNNGVGGFRVYHATGSLDNCMVDGNNVTGAYGAIAFHSYMSITNSEIKNTKSYGGYYANHSDGHFDNNNVHDCFAGLAAKIGSFAQTKGTTFDTCATGIFYDTGSDALWDVATTTFTNCTQNVDCNNIYRFVLGTTAQRPALGTGTVAGQAYFDVTLGKPIWVNKTNNGWIDATGAAV